MHWLLINLQPFDSGDGLGVSQRLPCPADELLQLAAATDPANPTNHFIEQVRWSLRTNPAMLLFALSNYFAHVGRSVGDAEELVDWVTPRLLTDLKRQPLAALSSKQRHRLELDPSSEVTDVWSEFLRARRNEKLSVSLNRWLKHFTTTDKATRKRWLKAVLNKQFRADQFSCAGVRKASTQKAILQRWASDREVRQLPSILGLAVSNQALQQEFDSKLLLEKLAAMKQLAYGASHEINNPLANVATRAQTMLGDEEHPEKRRKLAVIYQQAMRAHEMISDMMLFAHPPALKREAVSLRVLMRRLIGQWEAILQRSISGSPVAAEVNLRIVVAGDIDQVEVDPGQCLIALSALIKNSVEAIQAKPSSRGEVDIRVHCQANALGEGELRVVVADDGIGIDAEVAKHLFDPFYSGREAGRGLGFGLSKAWRIAEQHGGRLSYDGSSANGARFEFRVPTIPGHCLQGRESMSLQTSSLPKVKSKRLRKTA